MSDNPKVVEFTVGVCVTMTYDADSDQYVIAGPMRLTDGGLFSDACEGPWSPDDEAWINCNTSELEEASNDAARAVRQAVNPKARS